MIISRRGISAIVATVLIILITIAAVTILWGVILPIIQKDAGLQDINTRLEIVTSGGYTVYDNETNLILIQVKRSPSGGTNIVKNKITITFGGNSYSEVVEAPEPNQAKTYAYNITSNVLAHGKPESVSVAPIFVEGSSAEEGSITSEVSPPPFGKIFPIPNDLEIFGDGECIAGQTPDQECGSDIGECSKGIRECLEGNFWGGCGGSGYAAPSPEICDGSDNDCNGAADDGVTCACTNPGTTQPTTCGVGDCANTGTETCINGVWSDNTCVPGTPLLTCSVGLCGNWSDGCGGVLECGTTCTTGYCNSTNEGVCKQCLTDINCDDTLLCTTDTCSDYVCSNTPINPICPSADTVPCGDQITPSNDCGTCSGTGTYCATGTCNGVSCTSGGGYPSWLFNNLFAWWRMDDVDGVTVIDYMTHRNGTSSGNAAQTNDGHNGKGFTFDGASDYITFPATAVNLNNGSISIWFKTSANFSAATGQYGAPGNAIGFLLCGSNNIFYAYLGLNGFSVTNPDYYLLNGEADSQDSYYTGSTIVPAGQWNHLGISFENRKSRAYLNGGFLWEVTVGKTTTTLTLTRIGGNTGNGYNTWFNGTIDDVMIFNRSLSASEMQELHTLEY